MTRDPLVTVFTAEGCHLCERALEAVREAQAIGGFEADVVDITGDAQLEADYRALVPVVEIDGVRAFTYFVTAEALLERIGRDGSPPH